MSKIIGNKNNKSYHLDTCQFAPKSKMKIEEFATIEEAKAAGFKACSTCNPDSNVKEEVNIEGFEKVEDTSDLPFGESMFAGMNPPVETKEEPKEAVPEKKVSVVGNSSNKSYHLTSCQFAPKSASKKVEFESIEEAKAQGYKPCSTCNPGK